MRRIDLSGQVFGDLIVINYSHTSSKRNEPYWNCKCNCGKELQVKSSNLRNNKTKSCGCQSFRKIPNLEYVGKQFGDIIITKIKGYKRRACIYEYKCLKCNFVGQKWKSSLKKNHQCKNCNGLANVCVGKIDGILWSRFKHSAKTRDLEFNLTREYIWNLFLKQKGLCALSGIELVFEDKDNNITRTASLDRIDSTKGYVEDNVQWVDLDINLMKNNHPESKFLEIVERIYKWKNRHIVQ